SSSAGPPVSRTDAHPRRRDRTRSPIAALRYGVCTHRWGSTCWVRRVQPGPAAKPDGRHRALGIEDPCLRRRTKAEPAREQSASVWMATAKVPGHRSLTKDAQADVCVVGAGVAGMSVAYLLAQEGKSVIVLDDGPVAGGQTQRTTAHLSNAIDDRFVE